MNEKSMLAAADTLKALRDEKSDLQAKLKDVLPDWLEGVIQVFEQPSIRVSKSKK